jgi:predicted RNase H-like HicB family nuclease
MTLVTKEPIPDDAQATFIYQKPEAVVRNEFTAIIERDEDWYVSHCLEIPGAHGQGKTREDVLENLAEAILLHLEMRREDGLRGVPAEAVREAIVV